MNTMYTIIDAIKFSNLNRLRESIRNKVDVGVPNNIAYTFLMGTIDCGHLQLLIDAGLDLNIQDDDGDTAIINVIVMLLDVQSDLDIQNTSEYLGLFNAIEKGCIDMLEALIDAGADLNIQNSDGDTALILAVEAADTECLKILIEAGADLNIRSNDGKTALIYAVRMNNVEHSKALIEAGADVNDELIGLADKGRD